MFLFEATTDFPIGKWHPIQATFLGSPSYLDVLRKTKEEEKTLVPGQRTRIVGGANLTHSSDSYRVS